MDVLGSFTKSDLKRFWKRLGKQFIKNPDIESYICLQYLGKTSKTRREKSG
jgi:hypothetical protein